MREENAVIIWMGVTAMLVCLGGLESDEEARTYDNARASIPGLYVAGNIQGNRYAVEYPICVKGISHSLLGADELSH